MAIIIEYNGQRIEVDKQRLFQMAADGEITPQTKLWSGGRETTCGNVKGLTFGAPRVPVPPVATPSFTAPETVNSTSPVGGDSANATSNADDDAPEIYGLSEPTPPPASPENNANSSAAETPSFPSPKVVPIGARESSLDATMGERVSTPFLDYMIAGGSTPYVICYLAPGRSIRSSSGGRTWMKGDIETITQAKGGMLSSLGRMVSGETFFMSEYQARGPSEIAFATKMPGMILARVLGSNESMICQKGAYLASTPGVSFTIHFQKKLKAGLFGGEGFIMQRVTGPGVVFLELDGAGYEYDLKPGEKIVCDTGALAWCDSTCTIEAQMVSGIKNILFGGEGLFNTVITGPGKATFQTMSAVSLAQLIWPFLPHTS